MDAPLQSAPEVEAGPIRSERVDAMTTIWRDGSVIREDRHGQVTYPSPINPIPSHG